MGNTNRELNKRKLQALRMAGYNVKVDGSWGPWQEKQYRKISTHKKHYLPDILGFFTSLYDKATENDTYYEEPSIVTGKTGEIKADNRSDTRRKVDRMLLSSDNPVGYVVRNVLPAGAAAAGLVYGAPAALSAVKTVAPAALPSTFIDGLFTVTGTTAPAWLTTGADMALSFKYANDARKELNLNGLNWETGTNAVLSAIPATKGGNSAYLAIDEIKSGVRATLNNSKAYRTYRIAKELDKGIKSTKFTNVPVYHVTDYLGNDLRPFSMTDLGLHVTPNYRTAQGAKVNLNRPQMALPVTVGGRTLYSNGLLFNLAAMNPSNLAPYDLFNGTAYLITGRTLEEGIIPFREDVRRMYNSKWYRDRMLSLGKSNAEVGTAVKQINKNLDNTEFYVSENLLPPNWGAATGDDGVKSYVMFNGSMAHRPSGDAAIHEFGHVSEVNNPIIKAHNQNLVRNLEAKIDRTGFTPEQNENLDYFLKIYGDGGTEISGQIRNALVTMQLKNITPKQYINSQYVANDSDLSLYRDLLGDDVLEQVLKVALSVTPLIALNNGTERTSKSDLQR